MLIGINRMKPFYVKIFIVAQVVLCLLTIRTFAAQINDEKSNSFSCGYESCPVGKPDMINMHLVPHSHDDVGWLKTVDQYYYGSKDKIQEAGVQYILDSVVTALTHDPDKKFIYVETGFFWRWWQEQGDHIRHRVHQLVKNGQLEFIGGGWSMADEATTHYNSLIDEMTWGFRRLNDTFGECGRPKVGWQIDPFGHSREMASLFAQMGMDGEFFARIDYQDRTNRKNKKAMEMVWQASESLGKEAWLFTGVFPEDYSEPAGFCFDVMCDDEPIMDDPRRKGYNAEKRVDEFLIHAKSYLGIYKTNHIMFTMGGDFQYQNALKNFKNMDKLIKHINERQSNGSKYNAFYSTPSCYLKALHDANMTWPTKTDDFFPYSSDPNSFWTGYFVSRPTIKYFERQGNNILQICKQLHVLARLEPNEEKLLTTLREAMAEMQHHDAVTGTEKQAVAEDYAETLALGITNCELVIDAALRKISVQDQPMVDYYPSCHFFNISQCAITERNSGFILTVYNPIGRTSKLFTRIPVTGVSYTVTDQKGNTVPSQLVPLADRVKQLPGRVSQAEHELVFIADHLPPLGYLSYYVTKRDSVKSRQQKTEKIVVYYADRIKLGTESFGFDIDGNSGLLTDVRIDGKTIPISQTFSYYKGCIGNNSRFNLRSSGAYIFRPNGSIPIEVASSVKYQVYQGDLVEEVHQVFNDWISQVIRVYPDEKWIEFDWIIGPIPIKDGIGKEVITRYTTELETEGLFYTDSNGREMIKRQRDNRPTWKVDLHENVSGNYYPINSRISIEDEKQQIRLTAFTDRSQGGTSLKDGEIEIMLHRRLLHDDAFGVGEALNETAFGEGLVVRGTHRMVFAVDEESRKVEKRHAEFMYMPPRVFPAAATISEKGWLEKFTNKFSGITLDLPENVHLLTLEPWKANSVLLRLENQFEKKDDSKLGQTVSINLKGLFQNMTITWIRETTLGANQWIEDSKRFEWNIESNDINFDTFGLHFEDEHQTAPHSDAHQTAPHKKVSVRDLVVTLDPMQIRTFIVKFSDETSLWK